MLSKEFIKHLENLLSEKIISTNPLSGGDINEVFLLTTNDRKVVVKINNNSKFREMFKAEARCLKELTDVGVFIIPGVLEFGEHNDITFLVLDYIEEGKKVKNFWSVFGEKLATLHKNSKSCFGFESDNYIGSLPQYNSKYSSASEFYIAQRLQPQFALAMQKGFSFKNLDSFYENTKAEIPSEASSLIHGDLWSGNFISAVNGYPCLIDPAVAYAPREMDIAMMHLFGGFDQELFGVYNEIFPLIEGWKTRLEIWQLYYLLVHLNLFGDSYLSKIQLIIRKYS
ncbi:fructosamine kinase family protein [uncultured Aquimarina sp.]|uniref:fructosamine kinase family protein n=1 Tax=uncultured Aquimarina sp. TaxID=575652 RepID=UPI00260BF0CC|nr:fructosamine kinase family protein [uncultured Aquimarina sp.]